MSRYPAMRRACERNPAAACIWMQIETRNSNAAIARW
jgi:hypothetical protein